MRWLSKVKGYAILTLVLILFTLSVFLSVDRMLKEQANILQRDQENIIWVTSQTEVELYRFLDAVMEFGRPDSTIDRQRLNQRYEIFLSQFQALRQGRSAEILREIDGVEETVDGLWARLEDIEPSILFIKSDDAATLAMIEDEIEDFTQPVHQLGTKALHHDETVRAQQRERIQSVYLELIGYFIGILVTGSILVILLFRGMRQARRLLEERELTEERLRESEGRFQDFASSSSDWLWETDNRLRFTYFSKGYLEKVGVNAVAILGKTFQEIAVVDGEADREVWIDFRERLEARQPFREFQFDMQAENEAARHIKVSGVPNFNGEGELLGYRGTGTDITAQVEAETEAERVRALLADAVEALAEGFAMFDPLDRLVLCNGKFREMYPQSADLIQTGVTFEEFMRGAIYRGQFSLPQGQEEEFLQDRLMRHRDPQDSFEQRLSDGRWLKVIEQRLENGWRIGTRVDITDLKQREETLRREALIWEQMHDGVMITDLQGHITNWNPAAEDMFGYSAPEILGHTPAILRGQGESDALTRDILDSVEREGRWSGEMEFARKDGSETVCETLVAPLRTEHGDTIAIIWVNHDISLRKRSEAAMLSAKDQAELANRAKSQFLATMSHEIRTPMNGVLGMIDLLLDTGLREGQRGYADTARESGEALLTIIDDILDFSKMEAGKLELEATQFELRHVIEGVVELMAPRAQAKNIDIAGFVAPDVPTVVTGDPGRFRQVLLNLTGNAVKFTEDGGVSVRLFAEPAQAGKAKFRIEVEDSGVGVPPDQQADLFGEFTQVDPSYTRKYGGTGLGLAISKKLTELMGGEIGLESRAGEGSTFHFTVVLDLPANAVAPHDWRRNLAGLRVMVVDGVDIIRDTYSRQLDAAGIAVESTGDPAEAMGLLQGAASRGEPFDLALIGKSLPAMSGVELGQMIHGTPETAGVKLVLTTPLVDRDRSEEILGAGMDAHLTKPARQAALLAKIAELAGRRVEPAAIQPTVDILRPEAQAVSLERARQTHLLLAEDSKVNQVVALAMLEKAGYRVDAVSNGREAVEAVQAHSYDLVLMDVSMPEMDGFDATTAIRRLPSEVSRIPIIAMTAHAMEGDRERCLQAGMNDYVSKPVDRRGLLDTVGRWLGDWPKDAGVGAPVAAAAPAARPAEPTPIVAAGAGNGNGQSDAAFRAGGNGANDNGVLNMETFRRLESDTSSEILHNLIRTFITETAGRLRRMSEAAIEPDIGALEAEAHALRSSSGAFGAHRLQEQAMELELACRNGRVADALDILRPIHGLALEASRALISRGNPTQTAAE